MKREQKLGQRSLLWILSQRSHLEKMNEIRHQELE